MISKHWHLFFVGAVMLAGSFESQAAVVELGSTTMIFSASGHPNTISGAWNSAPLNMVAGSSVHYYQIQLTELTYSSSNNLGRPEAITFYSYPYPNGGANGLSLCWNALSCPADTVVGDIGIVGGNNPYGSAWVFLSMLADGHTANPQQFTDLYVSFYNGGGTGTASGQVLVQAFGIAPVPEPETYAMFLAGLGLVGFMASRERIKH